jgi:glycosyltransferase involved in cell wall biosynthesis
MRVLHVLEDFSRGNTGVTATVDALATWQAPRCDWVGIYATGPLDRGAVHTVQVVADPLSWLARRWRLPLHGSKTLSALVRSQRIDVLHVHGLWRAASWLAAGVARDQHVPWVLSVHGQCSPWALHGQGWLKQSKKAAYWAMTRARLDRCTALHAITPREAGHLQAFFDGRPADAIIPNALDTATAPQATVPEPEHCFLFLGRLHPVKAVDRLIEAFAAASLPVHWRVIVAGPEEDPAHARMLRNRAVELGMAERIIFTGPAYGEQKVRLLANAWAVVVPSHTEVVGMVNLEAAWCRTPSITTHATGLHDWAEGGGTLVDGSIEQLRDALATAASWDSATRAQRGNASRSLVERRYVLDSIGPQWLDLYAGIAG